MYDLPGSQTRKLDGPSLGVRHSIHKAPCLLNFVVFIVSFSYLCAKEGWNGSVDSEFHKRTIMDPSGFVFGNAFDPADCCD